VRPFSCDWCSEGEEKPEVVGKTWKQAFGDINSRASRSHPHAA
jgi:hypothetical protein